MSEVKMKTVTVFWSEKLFYNTTMEVPEDWTDTEIERSFWQMDLSNEKPVDTDIVGIGDIYRSDD